MLLSALTPQGGVREYIPKLVLERDVTMIIRRLNRGAKKFQLHPSLVTRPGYFLVVAAVLHGVAGLVFNGEITAGPQGV